MARQSGIAVENNFSKGLITESTALNFPPNACTETYDCVFDSSGRVTRRLGIDLEDDYTLTSVVKGDKEVFTEYMWTAVAGTGTINFVVQQQGSTLHFYDLSGADNVSGNKKSFTVDLTDHLPDNGTRNPSHFPCDYSQGDGKLLVANESCDPFYITYNSVQDTITSTSIVLKQRDFEGVDDGLTLNERVTESEASLKTNNPEHYYNLLNQGWSLTDALSQWDTARTDMPSNADYVALYREDEVDAFDNDKVTAKSPGNTPASKGHFILEVANEDRNTAMTDGGFTGATIASSLPLISASAGTIISGTDDPGETVENTDIAFDGTTSQLSAVCAGEASGNAASIYIGKNFTNEPVQIGQVIVYGSSDAGFRDGDNPSVTATVYGKNGSAPTSGTDGTSIGSVTFTDTSNESSGRTISISDNVTVWDYVWVNFTAAAFPGDWAIAEVRFYGNDPDTTFYRPSNVEFFAGRAWYAGIKTEGLGHHIFFTQIIENEEQFDKCYQENDPTAEDNSQLLPSDGGVVKIPDMGSVIKLFATQTSLIVFATNGIWLIGGSAGSQFSATEYSVSKLSTIGSNSAFSFANIRGLPFWWAESDIYTVQFDPNYNSFAVKPVTTESIQGFIRDVPSLNRRYVKGCYNTDDGCAYWLYNSSSEFEEADYWTYDRILVLDTSTGAFYPWTIGEGDPVVRGLLLVSRADTASAPVVKYTTTVSIDATNEYLSFSEAWNDSYKDWTSYSVFTDVEEDEIDYSSYFITGFKLEGQAVKKFQSNYVYFFMDYLEESSAYMQAIWDFTNTTNSGRWSIPQQIYNDNLLPSRNTTVRRLKVRGHGKALQFRVESEEGKPFSIIGWAMAGSINGSI